MPNEISKAYNKAVVEVMPEVARKFMNELIRTVPVDTGALKQSIKMESINGEIVITMFGYAAHLEWGTTDHMIRPKKGGTLHWTSGKGGGGKDFFSKGHKVRGIEPQPFIRPAINTKLNEIFTEEIARSIKSQSPS